MKQIHIGYGHDSSTQMGPVVSPKQRDRVLGYLRKAREEVLRSCLREEQPKSLAGNRGITSNRRSWPVAASNVACREEIFGPVPFVLKFRDEDDAINLVNQSRYGLRIVFGPAIYSAPIARPKS